MVLRASLFALTLVAGTLVSEAQAHAAPADDTAEAKSLYEEGRKAYRRGDMSTALQRFERAYDLTENPIILYNIGLTYSRLYETSNEVEHLRKAKVVLDNFSLELVRDPGLGEFPDLEELKTGIEAKIASQEDGGSAPDGAPAPGPEPTTPEGPEAETGTLPAPPTQDTGRTLRLAGIGLLGGGGALGVGAAVGALVSQKRYFEEVDALDQAEADAEAAGCPDASNSQCAEYDDLQQQLADRANAYRRNIGIFAGGLGGLAVASLATGGALLAIGIKRRNTPAKAAQLRIVPGWGSVSLQGRWGL